MAHRIGRDVRGRRLPLVRRHRHVFYQLRQIRCRGPRQRLLQVTPAGQRLNGRRRRLRRPLQVTAGTVRRHHRLVIRRLCQIFPVFIPRRVGVVIRRAVHFAAGFRGTHRADFTFGADNVHHLRAQFTDHLRRLQPLLLFLLVKYRTQRITGVCHITAQAADVLLLTGLIADNQRPVAHRRVGGTAGVAAAPQRHQCRRHGQRRRFQHVRHPQRRAGAQPDAAVRHRKRRLIADIAPAQRPGIQPVVIRTRRRAYHRPVQLGVVADVNVVAALTGKQPGLLLHAVITAVQLILTGAQVTAAREGAEGKATARRHTGLRRVITVAVLLTGQQQVAAHIGHNAPAADLRTGQPRVPATGQPDPLPRIHRGFRPAVAAAQLTPSGRIGIRKHAQPGTVAAQPDTDADIPAAATVAAGQRLGIAGRQQVNPASRGQLCVVARFQLAADGGDIALTRHHADIMACTQRRGKTLRLFATLTAAGTLRPQRHAEADKRRRPLVVGIYLRALIRLIPRQHRLHPLQRLQPAVALLMHCLHRLQRAVQRRPHHPRQGHAQPGGFLLHRLRLTMAVVTGVNGDRIAHHLNIPRRHHIGGGQVHVLPGTQAHRPAGASQRAHTLAFRGPRRCQRLTLRRTANGKADAAPAEQPTLLTADLLILPVGLHTGRGVDSAPGCQRHIAVRRHRRAAHPDILSRRQRHATRRQQRPLLRGLPLLPQRVRGGAGQETFLHRGFFKKVVPAFRCRQQAQVTPRLRRQRPAGFRLRPLQRQVLTRPQAHAFARVQRRALLRHRLLPVQMPVPGVRAELLFTGRQQAQVPSRRQCHGARGAQLRRRAHQVAPGAQAQVAPAGKLALHQPLTAPLAVGAAGLVYRVRQRGQRRQPEVVACCQRQRPTRAQLRPVQRDIVPRL